MLRLIYVASLFFSVKLLLTREDFDGLLVHHEKIVDGRERRICIPKKNPVFPIGQRMLCNC